MLWKNRLKKDDLALLARAAVLRGLNSAELTQLAEHCRVQDIKAGETVLEEGHSANGLFIILDGQVEAFLPRDSAHRQRSTEIVLGRLQPGSSFGEYSLFDQSPAFASIRSSRDLRLVFLSAIDLEVLANDEPRIGMIVYRNLMQQVVERIKTSDRGLDLFARDTH
ncbi:MAG: cyclic nucleotide-binding domain-containing protein [Leptospiraceae bacterium]|nr:cyclic nucleotide-binding domain-containing protein [Leptospiraceae bacterium]